VNVLDAVARLALAAVFAAAAWAKLSDRAGTRQAAGDFGVPAAAVPAVAFLLPVAELTVAVLLTFGGAAAMLGAIGAICLLVLFTAAVGFSLAKGRRPDCHCFGRVRPEVVSSRTLVRNGVLFAVACLVLAGA
jgi:uncharacterized membrane protein YphA (DoxX/SURF4 family)